MALIVAILHKDLEDLGEQGKLLAPIKQFQEDRIIWTRVNTTHPDKKTKQKKKQKK